MLLPRVWEAAAAASAERGWGSNCPEELLGRTEKEGKEGGKTQQDISHIKINFTLHAV